jgi:hypothetical protein
MPQQYNIHKPTHAKNPRRESTGAPTPNIYNMTPFDRDQDFKCHTSIHMEEELTRRHGKK